MTKILAFAGEKQSGKSSAGNFISGLLLKQADVIKRFAINEDGDLIVNALYKKEDGSTYEGDGILKLDRTDPDYCEYASRNIWPHVKLYSFASLLKELSIELFDLERESVYGADFQKEKSTKIKWETMRSLLRINGLTDKTGFMTHREFLQYFGSEVCRAINPNCWINACFKQIAEESPGVAIITDARFEDEIKAIRDTGGTVIRLEKSISKSAKKHVSEQVLSFPAEAFDASINNQEMTITEKNDAILKALYDLNWFKPEMGNE